MKLTVQHLNNGISRKHAFFNLNTHNIQDAVMYALKKELGIDSKITYKEPQPTNHHHCDLFCVLNVSFQAYVDSPFIILVNGKEETHFTKKLGWLDSQVRVEVTLEPTKNNILKQWWTNFCFKTKAKSEFRT